ncbi:phage virion morphogenesis protein [Thermus sp. PS18]|uniref:phage virion morphogenesis protein n=1 Tax=Thermus sp. PS18 TaxID=2849039 RepID=UPI002264773C|nr:phage virion morphogenesis protein [Thermus sp. PS18]UZX16555.1 phage virion morphogenesis protein [Thermus sp. PS18]
MSVRGDFRGLDRLLRTLDRLTRPEAMREVSRAAAEGAMVALSDRFRTATDPHGRPWVPSLRARLEGGQTLSDTGRLRRSFHVTRIGPDGFTIGTNVIYAAPHQFGAVIRPRRAKYLRFRLAGGRGVRKGGRGRWVTTDRVELPARPFFPVDDLGEYLDRIREAVEAYWERL